MALENQISKRERIPGLDGLRVIAIGLLVLGHLCQPCFWYGDCPFPSIPLPGGALSILFVLCGFFAGYFPGKTVRFKSYYISRAKRLFPAYYFYIGLVILVYILLGRAQEVLNFKLLYYIVPAGIIPFCHSEGILPLVHLWFLTPIVISYILFPLVLRNNYGGLKSVILTSLVLCTTFVILKWGLYIFEGKDTFAYRFFNASQFDCIFGGLCLGLGLGKPNTKIPRILNNKVLSCILWVIFLTSGLFADCIPSPARNEFFGILAAGLIVGLVGGSSLFKFEAPIWSKLSKASYYIYVYHILVIILISELCRLFI